MMELKFVSKESDYIVFETTDGQRMRAILDEQLRDAIRKTAPVDNSAFSPKEVQALIRSGSSVEEVANKFGVPVSALEPFAAPILDELTFVLQAALSTSVSDGNRMRPFEELILESHPGVKFKAYKEDGDWMIAADSDKSLIWSFSPKSRTLEPVTDASKSLARHPSNKRDVVTSTLPSGVSQIGSKESAESPASAPEDSVAAVPTSVASPSEPASENAGSDESTGASVHDLVEELRARRQAETDVKPQPAKGRASLPSWDEIVLGTASLDSDSD